MSSSELRIRFSNSFLANERIEFLLSATRYFGLRSSVRTDHTLSQSNDEKFFWQKNFRDETSSLSDEDSSVSVAISNLDQKTQSAIVRKPITRTGSKLQQETKLVIGIPVHNSEASIAKTVVALRSLNVDIIVCDDFSTDATEEIARELGCKVIKHPKELGFSDCVTSLFLASRRLHASNLLTVDVGMDFTLRDALNLLEKVQSGECDIAIGSDYSRDVSPGDTIENVRDTYSLFRAYGRRALALISPPGTTSVVMEYDVLDFAKQQGLKVKEFPISSASSQMSDETSQKLVSKIKSIPSKIEASLGRTLGFVALRHPLLFFGTPAIAMLATAGVQAIEAFQFWRTTGARPDLGFYYAGFDLIVSLILGIGALILESQNKSRTKDRPQRN